MSSSSLTVLGLYEFGQYKNDDLFKNIPEINGIDRQNLIDTILEKSASFECIYPEYDYMVFSIGAWWKRWERTFKKWVNVLNIKYDPLNNFDRKEDYTDRESEDINRSNKASGTSSNNGHTETNDTVDEIDTNSVVAYNSDNLHLKEQNIIDRDGHSTTDDSINSKADTTENEDIGRKRTFYHNARLYGNIGVTTSQQMLTEEIEVSRFNLIEQIADIFITEYCILVY